MKRLSNTKREKILRKGRKFSVGVVGKNLNPLHGQVLGIGFLIEYWDYSIDKPRYGKILDFDWCKQTKEIMLIVLTDKERKAIKIPERSVLQFCSPEKIHMKGYMAGWECYPFFVSQEEEQKRLYELGLVNSKDFIVDEQMGFFTQEMPSIKEYPPSLSKQESDPNSALFDILKKISEQVLEEHYDKYTKTTFVISDGCDSNGGRDNNSGSFWW